MRNFRLRLNSSGVREILKSEGVGSDLLARAERIAAAAGDGFVAESSVGATRARASVRTDTSEARLAESNDRALTRAIDAGR